MSLRFGIFHTLSAINNAGLDIIGTKSLQPYYHNYYFLFLTSIIFLIGGMGSMMFDKKLKASRKTILVIALHYLQNLQLLHTYLHH